MINFSNAVFKLKSIPDSDIIKDVLVLMLPEEKIISAYKSGRDQVVFTNKEI